MKKFVSLSALIFFILVFFSGSSSFPGKKRVFSLKEDLSIGVESGDENLAFGSVASIGLDATGYIYILDQKNRRIQIFDPQGKFLKSVIGKQGQGPEEVAMLGGVAVSPSGTIAVLDRGGNKVILFDKDGVFLRMFKVTFPPLYLGCLQGDCVVVLGLSQGKIFHLFDAEGRLLVSFGEPFEVPSRLSQFKDIPQMKFPLRFNCSPDGTIFIFNPHKFEIYIYRNAKLIKKVEGKSDLFEPVRVPQSSSERVAMVFPFLTVLEFGERLYVTIMRPATKGEGSNELIIYEGDKPVGTLAVDGMPRAVDSKGRLYVAEEADFPRMKRYQVLEK